MWQPRDLGDLLTVSDKQSITAHGQANRRDLSEPDDRFFLRIEVAHACRSSDDTSRRLKDAMIARARDGKPHAGRRRYGYASGGTRILPDEAQVVREAWRILAVLDSRHVAGIRVFRGEEIGPGDWEPVIDPGTWAEARDRRSVRADAHRARCMPHRSFLLRGLVFCTRCGISPADEAANAADEQELAGFTGPGARTAWDKLTQTGNTDRQNAILRFLFAAVIIDENGTPGVFDYTRIEIEPNPLEATCRMRSPAGAGSDPLSDCSRPRSCAQPARLPRVISLAQQPGQAGQAGRTARADHRGQARADPGQMFGPRSVLTLPPGTHLGTQSTTGPASAPPARGPPTAALRCPPRQSGQPARDVGGQRPT
jgi:hypothetical protein